jgi:hypothetical protein
MKAVTLTNPMFSIFLVTTIANENYFSLFVPVSELSRNGINVQSTATETVTELPPTSYLHAASTNLITKLQYCNLHQSNSSCVEGKSYVLQPTSARGVHAIKSLANG